MLIQLTQRDQFLWRNFPPWINLAQLVTAREGTLRCVTNYQVSFVREWGRGRWVGEAVNAFSVLWAPPRGFREYCKKKIVKQGTRKQKHILTILKNRIEEILFGNTGTQGKFCWELGTWTPSPLGGFVSHELHFGLRCLLCFISAILRQLCPVKNSKLVHTAKNKNK